MSGALPGAEQFVSQARELYDIWIKANGDDPKVQVALFNNSALATEQGDDVSAEGDLREALARDPNFLPAYINLGSVLERAGAIDVALDVLFLVERPAKHRKAERHASGSPGNVR